MTGAQGFTPVAAEDGPVVHSYAESGAGGVPDVAFRFHDASLHLSCTMTAVYVGSRWLAQSTLHNAQGEQCTLLVSVDVSRTYDVGALSIAYRAVGYRLIHCGLVGGENAKTCPEEATPAPRTGRRKLNVRRAGGG